jgi:hypothetical protein
MRALGLTLGALKRATHSGGNATRALRDAVAALERVAERAAAEGVLDAPHRRQLIRRAAPLLSAVIRRGVESGTFRPHCAQWAVESLPHAIVAGICARWAFGLRVERSLGAGAAADGALEALRPRVLARHEARARSSPAPRHPDHVRST